MADYELKDDLFLDLKDALSLERVKADLYSDDGGKEDTGKDGDKPDTLYAWLPGTDGDDTLEGTPDGDQIEGGEGDDTLSGGDGNDVIIGGPGADRIDGGDGSDLADYSGSRGPVMVDLAGGRGYSGDAAGDVLISIEDVTGSAYDDYIWGNDTDNMLDGKDGNDQLMGYGGRDRLFGGRGRDLLAGGDGEDKLYGDEGNDTLDGGAGNDLLYGGSRSTRSPVADGDDRLYGGDGNDGLAGGSGADYLDGGSGFDTAYYDLTYSGTFTSITVDLAAGTASGSIAQGDVLVDIEAVTIRGGAGHTVSMTNGINRAALIGGSGSSLSGLDGDDEFALTNSGGNHIDGGAGEDRLFIFDTTTDYVIDLRTGNCSQSGPYADTTLVSIEDVHLYGTGNHEVHGDGANNIILTSHGDDLVTGGGGADHVFGFDGDDTLRGNAGNDTLDGFSDNDQLFGGGGDDELHGGTGDDTLTGGAGNDSLTGDGGADMFVFHIDANDRDADVVEDFEIGIDTLDLSGTIIGSFGEFQGRTSQVGADAFIDTGDGSITLTGVNMFDLTSGDFVF